MSLLESVFGSSEQPVKEESSKPTIDLPRNDYTAGTPVAIRRSQLEASKCVIETNRETPIAETAYGQQLEEEINEVIDDHLGDDLEWEGREAELDAAENIIDTWLDDVTSDIGVVFVAHFAIFRLQLMLQGCEIRADNEHDPFELPDEFAEAVAFLKQLEAKFEDGDPVMINKDRVPTRD